RNVGDTVPDVPLAEAIDDLGLNVQAQAPREQFGHAPDRGGHAGPHVDGVKVGALGVHRAQVRLDDVRDVREVTTLEAVFDDHRRLPVEEAARENGGNAGVGIGEGLARAVD